MLRELLTEAQNPASSEIDSLSTLEMLRVINAADQEVALALHTKGHVELTVVDPNVGETTLVPSRGALPTPVADLDGDCEGLF